MKLKKITLLICLFVIPFVNFAQPGLVGCYPLDNNPNDLSGNNYNGTAHNVTSIPDRFGNANSAYHFSGSGSYVQMPPTGYLLNTYTYSLWVRPTAYPPIGTGTCVLAIGGSTADQLIVFDNLADPALRGFGGGGYYSTGQMAPGTLQGNLSPLNQWYHLVVTRDNQLAQLYINDVFIDTVSLANTNPGYIGGTLLATIGTRLDQNIQYFVGDVDDLKIFNRVLSPTEIVGIPNVCNCTPIPLDLTNDTSICSGASISLHALGAMNYLWDPPTGLSSTTGSAVNASPQNSTTYSVIGTDTLTGCRGYDQVTITVDQQPAQPTIQANGIYLAANTLSGVTYQWNYMGNPINGATSQFYTADSTGYYTVTAIAGGCRSTSNPSFVLVTGIEGIYSTSLISIFPNPVEDEFTIEMNIFSSQKQISVVLLSTIGESVSTHLYSDVEPGMFRKQFSTEDLQSGIYMLQIKFEDRTLVNKKVVIQK